MVARVPRPSTAWAAMLTRQQFDTLAKPPPRQSLDGAPGSTDENLRSFRACPTQSARVVAAQFVDYDRHFRRSGLAGCHAFTRHRLAEVGHAASGQVRSFRYRSRNLAPRAARL